MKSLTIQFVALAAVLVSCAPGPAGLVPHTVASANAAAPSSTNTRQVPPTPTSTSYDWRGMKLYLPQPLPESPRRANVYLAQPEQHAMVESVRLLAQQFGVTGHLFETPGELPGTTDYLVVDGNQQLHVRSDRYFTYYADYQGSLSMDAAVDNPNAASIIDEFLKSHDFNFQYKIEREELGGGYTVTPLTPDGFPIHYEYFKFAGFQFWLNKAGIVSMDASLMKYASLGNQYGILSVLDALQKLLAPNTSAGMSEGMHSAYKPIQTWHRVHPQDQTVTIYGQMNSIKSLEGGPPLVTIDGYTASGSLAAVPESMPYTFVEATGQYQTSDGVGVFNVEHWRVYDGYEDGLQGTIERHGDRVVITTQDNRELILPDMPPDIPLPMENAYVIGVTRGDTFEWKSIDDRMQSGGGGGGGGGGGSGFYKLNLSGTPFPLPTPAVVELPTQPQTGQQMKGLRGFLTVTFYNRPDGSQRAEYVLTPLINQPGSQFTIVLEGDLQGLALYHHRPLDVWGTIDHYDQHNQPVLRVDRYEVPFPGLKDLLVQGTQRSIDVHGQVVTLFTTEQGQSYVQLSPAGVPDSSAIGNPGDKVDALVLIVPGETFGGYPAMHMFNSGLATSPKAEENATIMLGNDQPLLMNEPSSSAGYTPPTATIEGVELVYYMPDPRYAVPDLNDEPPYVQPAWRFHGHYSNGDEFEVLIQALKDEYLLPELAPYTPPG
jgi:hypothetical protein